MTHRSSLQRAIDIAEAGRRVGLVAGEPIPTGRNRENRLAEYFVGDGYVYADLPRSAHSEVYLAADSVQFAAFVQQLRPRGRALELGSGSGVVSARLVRTCSHVTAVDSSARAAEASRATLGSESASDRFDVVHGDLFETLRETLSVDIVVANLPFVPVPNGVNYRRYGAGGRCGLSTIERVLDLLPGHLAERSTVCLKLHCGLGPGGPLVTGALRRFLERAGHAGCLVIDGDVPMGFRAGQSALNALALNPDHPNLLDAFDRHYADLGEVFASMVIVTESANTNSNVVPGDLTVIDQRPMPSWLLSSPPASLSRTLRQYGALMTRLPEGYSELGTAAMIDHVGDHAEEVLWLAASGKTLLDCAREGVPKVAEADPISARGYLVPVAQLRRAARMAGIG
jgi:SAM-dependent methyltransferase